MKDWKYLLREGINILRKSDEDIDLLPSPRGEKIISILERYVKEIELFNGAYGLVGTSDTNEIVIKHILDSLAPAGIITRILPQIDEERRSIADAGSGAGLPGIPLAVVLPDYKFTLIERMGRRAGFLLNTEAALSLSNITIAQSELEKIDKSARFNLITFRAFKPLEPKLLKVLLKCLAPEGIIAAYKGRSEKIKEEMKFAEDCGIKWEAISYKTPFLEEERHLVLIKT